MILSAPSKTFLVGEYGVLKGGPALLVNTSPRFELRVGVGLVGKNPFHKESPAGKLYQLHSESLKKFVFDFFDPHNTQGGFGASSAQFALLYSFLNREQTDDGFEILETYKHIATKTDGWSPSGYDVLAQRMGGVSLIVSEKQVCQNIEWTFSDLGFFLLRTGHKVATHQHLSHLVSPDISKISKISEQTIQAYVSSESSRFLESILLFRETLNDLGLTASKTVNLLKELDKNKKILAAKGCGALGADVVIVFFSEENRTSLYTELNKAYHIVSDDTQIQSGLLVEDKEGEKPSKDSSFEGALQ